MRTTYYTKCRYRVQESLLPKRCKGCGQRYLLSWVDRTDWFLGSVSLFVYPVSLRIINCPSGPNTWILILSTAIRPKLWMNSLLYTSKLRGKYILRNTSLLKICPSRENMPLSQLPGVDTALDGKLRSLVQRRCITKKHQRSANLQPFYSGATWEWD